MINSLINNRIGKNESLASPRDKYNMFISITLLSLIIFRQSILTYVVSFIGKFGPLYDITPFIAPVTIIAFLLLGINSRYKSKIKLVDFIVPIFLLFGIMFTYACYPQNTEYLNYNFWPYIFYCIPAFIIGLSSSDYNSEHFSIISKISCLAIAASYLLLFVYKAKDVQISEDAMSLSYPVLLPVLFVTAHWFYKHSFIEMIFILAGFVYLIAMGTRGPLVIAVLFLAFCFVQKRKHPFITFVVICALLLLVFKTNLHIYFISLIRDLVVKLGYSSRILDSVLNQELIEDASRDELYKLLFSELAKRPFLGYGLFGEWQYYGWNAHNIYLEMVFEYGWPLGIFLILFLILTTAFAYFRCKTLPSKYFIAILAFFVFVQGLRGYSHLRPEMFLLLGFCISENRKNNIRRHV